MKKQHLVFGIVLLSPVLRGDGCGPLLEDPAFELWCGDALCAWSVDRGAVSRVPTWHEADYGVDLGADGRISQALRSGPQCLEFTTLADVSEGASLELGIDFFDDGTIDHRQPIVGRNWSRAEFLITAPHWYERARVIVQKSGPGRAVLAELSLSARPAADCTADAVELRSAALGMPCSRDDDCQSGHCRSGLPTASYSGTNSVCATCSTDADCADGELCGLTTDSPLLVYARCTRPGLDPLGAACASAAECASGICCTGVCSTCCDGRGCLARESCESGDVVAVLLDSVPEAWRCAPGKQRRRTGEPCIEALDCASGVCSSTVALNFCLGSGRDCTSNDSCWDSWCSPSGTPGVCR